LGWLVYFCLCPGVVTEFPNTDANSKWPGKFLAISYLQDEHFPALRLGFVSLFLAGAFRVQMLVPGRRTFQFATGKTIDNSGHKHGGERNANAEGVKGSFARIADIFHQEIKAATQAYYHGNEQDDDEKFQKHGDYSLRKTVI
jgi:hypothetical protein